MQNKTKNPLFSNTQNQKPFFANGLNVVYCGVTPSLYDN